MVSGFWSRISEYREGMVDCLGSQISRGHGLGLAEDDCRVILVAFGFEILGLALMEEESRCNFRK